MFCAIMKVYSVGTTKGNPMNAPSVVKRITLITVPLLVIGLVATWLLTAPMREAAYDRDMAAKVLADPNAGYTGSKGQIMDAMDAIEQSDILTMHIERRVQVQAPMPLHPTYECFNQDVMSQEGGLKGCLSRVETAAFGSWMSAFCFTEDGMRKYTADKGFKLWNDGSSKAWKSLMMCVGDFTRQGRYEQYEQLMDEYYSLVDAATVRLRNEINAQAFPTQRAKAEAIAQASCFKPNSPNHDYAINLAAASTVFTELAFDKASTDSLWYEAQQRNSSPGESPFEAISQYVCSQQKR